MPVFIVERVRVVLTEDGKLVSVVAIEIRVGDYPKAVFRREGVTKAEDSLAVTLPADEVG